jgi:hypothetical protein
MAKQILTKTSLAETLWRLEETRLGFNTADKSDIETALEWIISRQAAEGAYILRTGDALFAPTKSDLKEYRLPTGERVPKSASNRHVLGEEALRTSIHWKRRSKPEVKRAILTFERILDANKTGTGEIVPSARETGYFCCSQCNPAFLRSVNVVKSEGWEKTLETGMKRFKAARIDNGRWHRFHFFYTLLMLSELDIPAARRELKYARPAAEKLVSRYENKTDRTSKFRTYAIEAALSA